MAKAHGALRGFDRKKEDWTSYLENIKFYFMVSRVADLDKKLAILLYNRGFQFHLLLKTIMTW